MIRIVRGGEPEILATVREERLAKLRGLNREPGSKDIEGYKVVSESLWRCQFFKCCYCETKIPCGFNDVEHYRPKGEADRMPGSSLTHGYWWLAFSWDNLLFACPACNRSGKNSRFPLADQSIPLVAEVAPPGSEVPLLLDPASGDNPVQHIVFVNSPAGGVDGPTYWWARPREGSPRGNVTISVCNLNRLELLELRNDYVCNILVPQANALLTALGIGTQSWLVGEYDRAVELLSRRASNTCLAYDVLRHLVPEERLIERLGRGWPMPG